MSEGLGWETISPKTDAYLNALSPATTANGARGSASRVESLSRAHDSWRARCLNMNAAENIMSRKARALLNSEFATRVTEGLPGDKEFPPAYQNVHIDEIEGTLIILARQLFRARFVEWRPVSTSMANAAAFFALAQPGDSMLVQSMEGGGNMSYRADAAPSLRSLTVHEMAPHDLFEIDLADVRACARRVKPRLIVVGGSYVLFPYPVASLREIADEVGALLIVDAAHVSLFMATGSWRNPLDDGAHAVTLSTHKIMGGPVGGMLVTNEEDIARRVLNLTFPAFIQTRDQNKYAAAAHAFAEMLAYGAAYAASMIANAKALGAALHEVGFRVIGSDRDYTASHQLFLDLHVEGARAMEAVWQTRNILVHAAHMNGDGERGFRTGLRLSVQEVTRQGMGPREMQEIASLMRRAVDGNGSENSVTTDVASLARRFSHIAFSFDAE